MHPRGFAVLTLLVVLGALLACKKKEEPTASSATAPTAEPAPIQPAVQTPPAESAAAAASNAPAASAAATPTVTTARPKKTDAGAKPTASSKTDAGAKPAPSASAAPSASPPTAAENYAEIQRCCNSLNAEAQKPGLNQNKYKGAASTCSGIAQLVKSGKSDAALARTTIRAQLHGVPIPPGC